MGKLPHHAFIEKRDGRFYVTASNMSGRRGFALYRDAYGFALRKVGKHGILHIEVPEDQQCL